MKSAYELAMERLGGPVQQLSDEQKQQIAEIEKRRKAKMAEAELARDRRMTAKPEDVARIQQEFRIEQASIEERAERDKEKIRTAR